MKNYNYIYVIFFLLLNCKTTQKETTNKIPKDAIKDLVWRQIGPNLPNKDLLDKYTDATQTYWHGEGRISSIWINEKDDNHILTGVGFGGLFETFDAGKNWKSITDQIPVNEINKIDVKDETIYISTGYRFKNPLRFSTVKNKFYGLGVVKSSDNGKTWHLPKTSFNCADFSISKKHQTIYAISINKVYKSINNGDSFEEVADFTNTSLSTVNSNVELLTVIVHPTNLKIAYVSAKRASAKNAKLLYKTIDGGITWTNEMPFLENFIKETPSKSIGHYIKDVALHFNEKSNKFWIHYSVVFQFKSNRVYKKVHSFILNSTNFTDFNFVMSQEIIGGQHFSPTFYEKDETLYLLAWYLQIKKPNDIKFTNVGKQKVHQDCRAVGVDSKGKIYYGNDAGLVKSVNQGETWTNAFINLNANLVYEMSYYSDKKDRRLAIGTQDAGYYLNKLDGLPRYPIGTHEGGVYISPHQKDRVYIKDNSVSVSNDGGKRFKTLKLNNGKSVATTHRDGLLIEDPVNTNTLYVGYLNNVFVSDSLGKKGTWRNITPKNGHIGRSADMAIPKSNNNILYLANHYVIYNVKNKMVKKYTTQTHLLKSKDKGQNWTIISTPFNELFKEVIISDVEVDDDNPNRVWFTLRNLKKGKKTYMSENGGKTWANISYNLPNVPANRIEYNQKTKTLILANDYGVYYLDGNVWKEYGQGLPKVIITSMALDHNFNELIVSTFGRGVWRVTLQ